MVLQLISDFGYLLVEQSWLMATVLVKYFLLGIGIKITLEKDFSIETVSDQLLEYSGEIVSVIVLLGLVNIFAGFSMSPIFNTFSQVTAFLYFAFLFWMY